MLAKWNVKSWFAQGTSRKTILQALGFIPTRAFSAHRKAAGIALGGFFGARSMASAAAAHFIYCGGSGPKKCQGDNECRRSMPRVTWQQYSPVKINCN